MADRNLDGSCVIRVDRVVAEFHVWVDAALPFAKMKVRVLERGPSDFLAIPNVAIRSLRDGSPEYSSGLGDSIEEALKDLLGRFTEAVRSQTPPQGLKEADFEWVDPDDF